MRHIVCCDCGEDPEYRFDDIANLVRKARIDFKAEITLCGRDELGRLRGSLIPVPAWESLGTAEEFGAAALRRYHALLAKVRYEDARAPASLILLVKPALSGDESIDLRQYQRSSPKYPHEPTSDQFFDEAQWESYRKLGEHSEDRVFHSDGTSPWWFTSLDPAKL